MRPALFAFAAGALGFAGAAVVAEWLAAALRSRAPGFASAVRALVETVARVGREGRDPGAVERRRLLLAAAAAAFALVTVVAGPRFGVVAGLAAPWAIGRVLLSRRER